uniref:Nudix hydrolase domain-containing protein n=1 Tax=Strongyloides stercoralis TaxID=6248 RepID=A0A0K0E455_STRER
MVTGLELLASIKNPSNFVLPGGGIEKEEDAKEAALREVKEEAGVICEILWSIGEFKDDKNGMIVVGEGQDLGFH